MLLQISILVSHVGQAFGGNNPVIQLNKLQTDSERNIKRGTNWYVNSKSDRNYKVLALNSDGLR